MPHCAAEIGSALASLFSLQRRDLILDILQATPRDRQPLSPARLLFRFTLAVGAETLGLFFELFPSPIPALALLAEPMPILPAAAARAWSGKIGE